LTPPSRPARLARCTARRRKQSDFKLDSFKWLREESLEDADDLPEPEELATDAIEELEGAVEELNAVLALLENGERK
jgi:type I restriction enzyme M protein